MTRINSTLSLLFAVLLTTGVMVVGQSTAVGASQSQCVTGVDYGSLTQAELMQFEAS